MSEIPSREGKRNHLIRLDLGGEQAVKVIHAYRPRDAHLTLCGKIDWLEVAPPDEVTCPACLAKLERRVA